MAKHLAVWLSGQHVGTLAQIDGRLHFSYTPAWLANPNAAPVSQSLPLRADGFDDSAARAYFAGLLPEGDKRKRIAQILQVSYPNNFGLLAGIGGECAGAISLLLPDEKPASNKQADAIRWLDDAAFLAVLNALPLRPMMAGETGLRLSLAGAQDKLPIVVDDDLLHKRMGLPLGDSPSSHIVKSPIASVEGSVQNEGFCLALASALKLDVVKAEVQHVQGRSYLLVERHDRKRVGNAERVRIHQEDFCQALAIAPENKYQNEGGPNLAQSFDLLRRVTRPSALEILKLVDCVIFNALIGNHDAHGKNFSLIYQPQGAVLAPLYDALSTAVYPQLTDKMAMKLGGKYRFSELHARHWEKFAHEAGLSPSQLSKRVLDIARRLPQLAHQVRAGFIAKENDHPILAQIVLLIEQRCAMSVARLQS